VSPAQPNEEPAGDVYDLRWFNELQIEEIQRHKWIESEKAGRDLGQDAAFDWICRHARAFREAYANFRGIGEGQRGRYDLDWG
jgi:hypothetical protein